MTGPRRAPLLAALGAAAATTAIVFSAVHIRTDMAAFLPAGTTPASRFMLQELQAGSVASLILVGIEGAPAADLARIGVRMADALDRTGLFTLVSNGARVLGGSDAQLLFANRLLLSPATTADAFTEASLKAGLARLLAQLQSSAAPLAIRFGLPDPIGAFAALAPAWAGASQVRTVDGVWFAPERDRALMVVQTRAPAMDLGAQDVADAALHQAFAAADPGHARLLASGPAEFARGAAHAIRSDIELVSVLSTILVAALLMWRFRSPFVIAAIAVPIMLGVAAAALAVQSVFGSVHGIAFGFGMTMLGVTVDYPVLLIGHRKAGEAAGATLRRIGQAFTLAVAAAALGLTGMVFSGFPGLQQLGLFAVVGVLVSAAVTWFALPRLIVAANLAPVAAGDPAGVRRIERWRRYRAWGAAPVVLAAGFLLAAGGPQWESDVGNLSPIPQAARDLNETLQRELGAPDLADLLVVEGADADAVLRRQEELLPAMARLQAKGRIAGFQAAAHLLPSAETQAARRAALPDAAALAARLEAARAGTPFRPEAFAAFAAAVANARQAPPVRLADLAASPVLAARLAPMLFQRDGRWFGPIAFTGAAHAAAELASDNAVYVNMHAETNGLVSGAAAKAGWWLAGSVAAAVAALLVRLRRPGTVARIVLSIGSAGLVTVALLTAAGVLLSLLHVAALQFTMGVGLDYALFYARRGLDLEERARTLRTLVTCNAMTLLTFGLLALCRTPLLQALGVTVALGAVCAMAFSFLFVGERPA